MAKNKTMYICRECGFKTSNWMGRCSSCGAWNSLQEMKENTVSNSGETGINPAPITGIEINNNTRYTSGIGELDRVLGGGIVSGSLLLLGGAPGIGKSTLILQAAFLFSNNFNEVLYVTGEESPRQIKLRANRLGILSDNLYIAAETDFVGIKNLLMKESNFRLVIIDSVQTIYDSRIDSPPGSIKQTKEITGQLLEIAKKKGITIILIGHITKEGSLAGPKALEHLVDTVLQLEGDRNYNHRILRSLKNRYGSTSEIGIFTMKETGMEEVSNPSGLFLQERPEGTSGSVIVPVLEGTRTVLVEVQALVSPSAFATPQRLATGVSKKRISILLAVLEKKAGLNVQNYDAHLNIVGGLKVDEPALDLGIVTAIISSFRDQSLPPDLAVVGEVGLAGEIRAVARIKKRLTELKKMGFKEVLIPEGNRSRMDFTPEVNLRGVGNIGELMDKLFL